MSIYNSDSLPLVPALILPDIPGFSAPRFDPTRRFDFQRQNADSYNYYTKGRFYVFMTKPDLNLATWDSRKILTPTRNEAGTTYDRDAVAGLALQSNIENFPLFKLVSQNYPNVIRHLVQRPTYNGGDSSFFMPLITNLVDGFPSSDISSDPLVYTETFSGERMQLARESLESQMTGTFTLEIPETSDLFTSFLFRVWIHYIDNVLNGSVLASPNHIYNRRIDYAASMYCMSIGPDGETIQFFSKYTGIFPISLGLSAFEERLGTFENVRLAVGFAHNKREDLIPEIIRDFNAVASENMELIMNPTGEGRMTASNKYELSTSSNLDRYSEDETEPVGGRYMFAEPAPLSQRTEQNVRGYNRVRIIQKENYDPAPTQNHLRYCLNMYNDSIDDIPIQPKSSQRRRVSQNMII